MPFPPRAGEPRDQMAVVRLTKSEVKAIAETVASGAAKDRSEYLRNLALKDMKRRGIRP